MVSTATSRFIRMSPQKARLVVDLIRGKNVNEALMTLKFTNKPKSTREIEKVVKSAVANATQKNEIQLTACSVTLPSIVHTPGYQNVHTSDGLSEMIRSCRIEPFEAVNRTKRFAY